MIDRYLNRIRFSRTLDSMIGVFQVQRMEGGAINIYLSFTGPDTQVR